jgi:hypothetical protein
MTGLQVRMGHGMQLPHLSPCPGRQDETSGQKRAGGGLTQHNSSLQLQHPRAVRDDHDLGRFGQKTVDEAVIADNTLA